MPEYLTAEEIADALRAEGDQEVSARTVHYYAAESLLPPPDYDGTRPRYTVEHLNAMREARQLRNGGLRLNAIKQRVQGTFRSGEGSREPSAKRPRTTRTMSVGPGLTLTAEDWSDQELSAIVRAIKDVLAERAEPRRKDTL